MEDTTGFASSSPTRRPGSCSAPTSSARRRPTLIQPLIQAMSFGLDAYAMARGQYWIHPALSEVVENALLKLKLDPEG